MKFSQSILAASALALAMGGAYAGGNQAKTSDPEPGFNKLDKNNDGKLTRSEAAADKSLLGKWKQADRNNDGVVTRSEYLMIKGKQDIGTAADKVKGAVSSDKSQSTSSAGSTKSTK